MTPSNTENAPSKPDVPAASTPPAHTTPAAKPMAERPYSPGLEGVLAAETAIGYVDGANGRLLYRGYPIGQLVEKGTYGQVAELLWTGEWRKTARLVPAELPEPVICALHELPDHTHPMDALRTAVSVWGAWRRPHWPPTVDQVRELTAFAPSALAAFHRIRNGQEPVAPNQKLSLAGGFLQQLNGKDPDPAAARALDAYFVVGAEHGLNASTFTCRVIISTRSDLASAVCGAIGALKGPLHGGAPAEVVSQLHEIGSPEKADKWVREAIARGDKIMGFGHRVYRAYDPRAAALRKVAEGMADMADWLDTAVKVEDVVLRIFGELKPDRVIKTNVEYYAAAVLQGVGLPPDLFPPTFALARMAGWGAHAIEQASADKLIRPDARYVGPPGNRGPELRPLVPRAGRAFRPSPPLAQPLRARYSVGSTATGMRSAGGDSAGLMVIREKATASTTPKATTAAATKKTLLQAARHDRGADRGTGDAAQVERQVDQVQRGRASLARYFRGEDARDHRPDDGLEGDRRAVEDRQPGRGWGERHGAEGHGQAGDRAHQDAPEADVIGDPAAHRRQGRSEDRGHAEDQADRARHLDGRALDVVDRAATGTARTSAGRRRRCRRRRTAIGRSGPPSRREPLRRRG